MSVCEGRVGVVRYSDSQPDSQTLPIHDGGMVQYCNS